MLTNNFFFFQETNDVKPEIANLPIAITDTLTTGNLNGHHLNTFREGKMYGGEEVFFSHVQLLFFILCLLIGWGQRRNPIVLCVFWVI